MEIFSLLSVSIVRNTEREINLNILHLARTMDQGGAEKIVYQLASDGKRKGHQIVVASCGGFYVNMLETQKIVHEEIPDLECKNPMVVLKILKVLVSVVRREKIDIIHTHHRMAALYGRLLKMIFPKAELVYTAHNVFENKVRLTRFALRGAKIIAVGESVRSNLETFFGISPDRIRVIFNAVELPQQEAEIPKVLTELQSDGYRMIGTIGRLSEQKGIDVFIQSFLILREKYRSCKEAGKLCAVIVGDGEQRECLQQQILDLQLQDEVFLLGHQKNIFGIIRQLELVVMPSRWEGFPLTPIEVFASGKTMVGSDIGGINEIVLQEQTGLLVPKEDAVALAEAVWELLSDTEKRSCLEKNALAYYQAHFDYESFVNQYEQVYQECAGRKL